jgi:hypothetical protein
MPGETALEFNSRLNLRPSAGTARDRASIVPACRSPRDAISIFVALERRSRRRRGACGSPSARAATRRAPPSLAI